MLEAAYVALSQSCKDFLPLLDHIKELAHVVKLPVNDVTKMHIKIHEDNVDALNNDYQFQTLCNQISLIL